ncbi:hydrogenase expression/formation protein HypD [Legionella nautarum]|uniref:Hydrogenase maturation factor n=1 Tax=Legionella nautarum TaxID=45070 RepID=A0A0W0WRV2_9GAMM|nr:hydrogenase formation protein HypD [Legionella nautarum]KTD35048.1 hydrogenase expression/formation protein HypD [Legionella nautarum]
MKYIEEFRDAEFAQAIAKEISCQAIPQYHYRLMEFCGGHTHTIHRYGLPSLLPANVELIHGPGCPVCILPIHRIDKAIALASLPQVIFCSYGDMLRIPGSNQQTLLQAKAKGADIRMVYSVDEALRIAQLNTNREVIFFAIGFETTTPPTAYALLEAKRMNLRNFSVFCNHVLTPAAMNSLLQTQNNEAVHQLDGFVGPAHVSIVTGSRVYESISRKFKKPIVISGFEPLDVLHSILMLIKQINRRSNEVEIQYTRAVTRQGNLKSQAIMNEVFALRTLFEWRGLGNIPESAVEIRPSYSLFDAEKRFPLPDSQGVEHKQCDCGSILRGLKKPTDCKLFAKVCTPQNPLGSCMVSSEGACAAVYAYGRRN